MKNGGIIGMGIAAAVAAYLPSASGSALVGSVSLYGRSVQSAAVCQAQYNWMDNEMQQPPCLVAGYLLGQCAEGSWKIDANTDPSRHYATPNATTANQCSCSWAVYNLMQACALCQAGFDTAESTWTNWNTNCTNFSSAPHAWPENTVIPQETSIPFWATQDPNTWTDAKFNGGQAQQFAQEDKPDLTNSNHTSKGSSAGAIAGGVVGGVLGASAIGLLLFFLIRRNRGHRRRQPQSTSIRQFSFFSNGTTHARSHSDLTQQKPFLPNDFTPSPGPSYPMTVDSHGVARPIAPFHSPATNGSFSTIPGSMSMAPQSMQSSSPDFSLQVQTPPPGMGGVAVPMSPPNGSISSVAFASRPGHAHTLSNQSNMSTLHSHERSFSMLSDSQQHHIQMPEGAISPFVLPDLNDSSPGNGPKGSPNANTPGSADGMPMTSTPVRRAPERLNPPAYSPAQPQDDDSSFRPPSRGLSFAGGSADAQASESGGLSGTTLRQTASSRDPTVFGNGTQVHSPISEAPELPPPLPRQTSDQEYPFEKSPRH